MSGWGEQWGEVVRSFGGMPPKRVVYSYVGYRMLIFSDGFSYSEAVLNFGETGGRTPPNTIFILIFKRAE